MSKYSAAMLYGYAQWKRHEPTYPTVTPGRVRLARTYVAEIPAIAARDFVELCRAVASRPDFKRVEQITVVAKDHRVDSYGPVFTVVFVSSNEKGRRNWTAHCLPTVDKMLAYIKSRI